MAAKGIPAEIKQQAQEEIDKFNRRVFGDKPIRYLARFKGMFLYIDREELGKPGPICRLKYTGTMDDWDFAIYKYSDGNYDAEEWMFPGSEQIDGTIEGALQAGLDAYEA